ncbi:MAG: SIMPL domain-containing protein [Fuerstia sp.]|nr:SIMPL domain-containing protein [Fuerstiella sp.]
MTMNSTDKFFMGRVMKSCSIILHALAVVLVPATAFGQDFEGLLDAGHHIVGVGTAELKRPANQMVALFSLKATGTSIREATAALQKTTDEAKAKILELGAKEDSIRVGVVSLHQKTEDANRMMMRQVRLSPGGRPSIPVADEAAAEELVTVATTIRGTWSLDGSSPSEALISSWELQKTIQKAEVMPKGTQEGLSPEQQEILEEASMFGNSGNDESSDVPAFVFVNSVTQPERAQLLKDAYQKAVEHARETAGVAGRAPGILANIRIDNEDAGNEYLQYRYQMSNDETVGQLMLELKSENPLALIGQTPSELSYQVVVKAGFQLAEEK